MDLHALRTTFGTLLSKGGISPRTTQEAMRHSDITLTLGIYTDPKLLDVHGAMDALPELPLSSSTGIDQSFSHRTTWTMEAGCELPPKLPPTTVLAGHSETTSVLLRRPASRNIPARSASK